jgi:uncharacterized protein YjbI with pentapeptide repeats
MAPETLADLPYAATLSPHRGPLAAGTDYDGAHFDRLDLAAPQAGGSHFMECALTGVTVQQGRFRLARFTDVWLSGVRLTATELTGTTWSHAILAGCVAAGVTMDAAQLRRVTFRNCKLDGVNLRGARLAEVSFTGCLLRDVDFAGATLHRCTFPGSQLREADFSHVSLEQVDLRGAELGLVITPGALRGATISPGQLAQLAPVLAEHAGIEVAAGQG